MSITPSTPAVSKIRRKQILSMVGEGRRVDGRSLLEYRNLEIEVGSIEKAGRSWSALSTPPSPEPPPLS